MEPTEEPKTEEEGTEAPEGEGVGEAPEGNDEQPQA